MSTIREYTFPEFENLNFIQQFKFDSDLSDDEVVKLYDTLLELEESNAEYVEGDTDDPTYRSLAHKVRYHFYSFEAVLRALLEEVDESVVDSDD